MPPESVVRVPVRWFSDDGFVVQYCLIDAISQNLPNEIAGRVGKLLTRRIVENTIEALIERGYCATEAVSRD